MLKTNGTTHDESAKTVVVTLPTFEDTVRLDDAIRLQEVMTHRMGAAGLLEVARGQEHPRVRELQMRDMSLLPPLPADTSSSAYAKLLDLHENWRIANETNNSKRMTMQLTYQDQVYSAIATACEKTAPLFYENLLQLCAYCKVHPAVAHLDGHYDAGDMSSS